MERRRYSDVSGSTKFCKLLHCAEAAVFPCASQSSGFPANRENVGELLLLKLLQIVEYLQLFLITTVRKSCDRDGNKIKGKEACSGEKIISHQSFYMSSVAASADLIPPLSNHKQIFQSLSLFLFFFFFFLKQNTL